MSRIVHPLNMTEYNEVINKSKVCMVDFYTTWCGPCKQLGINLEDWFDNQKLFENVTVMKIDAENENFAQLVGELQITAIPRVLYYQSGKKVFDGYKGINDVKARLIAMDMSL